MEVTRRPIYLELIRFVISHIANLEHERHAGLRATLPPFWFEIKLISYLPRFLLGDLMWPGEEEHWFLTTAFWYAKQAPRDGYSIYDDVTHYLGKIAEQLSKEIAVKFAEIIKSRGDV